MKLTAKASIQIQKPISEVFEAIIDPKHLTQYFISKSSGKMAEGWELIWEFGDFPGEFPVQIKEVKAPEFISFVWDEGTLVKIKLEELLDKTTVVRITEGEKDLTEENLEWLVGNTFGWGNFLDCLKAYLEYGIQLRKGAFEYLNSQT